MPAARAALFVFIAVFVAGLALFTRGNDFPFYYHPDEPGKVGQVTRNKRNLHHPLLMLTTVDAARRVVLPGEAKKDPQRVVQVGRWITAAFAALAAAALAALATRAHGWIAGLAVGALCTVNPLLYELAHYFKEDPYFTAGIAVTCLAIQRLREFPDARGFALLGAATALAAAGKYVGFALLPVAIVIVALTRKTAVPLRRRMGWMLGTFAFVWLAFNWWVFKSPELLWRSLGEETTKAFGGEDGRVRSVPHDYYVVTQNNYSTWVLWIGLGAWTLLALLRRAGVTLAEAVLAGIAVLLFVIFSSTPKTSPRYHLPVAVAISYFAALGAAGLGALVARRKFAIGGVVTLALLSGMLIPEWKKLQQRAAAFAQDDRVELENFVRNHLPANAVVAQDEASNLPEPERRWEHAGRVPLPQRVIGKKQIADRAELGALRAEGVTHLAICARTYLRFLAGGETPERRFYEAALKHGKVLFERPQGAITYLQPGLTLLDISGIR